MTVTENIQALSGGYYAEQGYRLCFLMDLFCSVNYPQ